MNNTNARMHLDIGIDSSEPWRLVLVVRDKAQYVAGRCGSKSKTKVPYTARRTECACIYIHHHLIRPGQPYWCGATTSCSAYPMFSLFGFFFQLKQCFSLTTIQPEQCFSASFSQNSSSRTGPVVVAGSILMVED